MATHEDDEAQILGDWQERRDRGEAIDPAEVIRAHPEMAEVLRRRFAALDFVDLALVEHVGPSDILLPGNRLGPYRLLSELGAGGMGRVYLARVEEHARGLEPGAQVAVKVVHAHLLNRRGFVERLLREAAVGKQVAHPNVVRTLHADVVAGGGRPIHLLVMEFVEGQTLRALLNELERVPEELCRHIGREVARGLDAIHATGAIHRDLKPENVLITKEHTVKVMDLGTARLIDEEVRLSQTGVFVGSLEYAAPEQFEKGGAEIDGRADLHALGVVLYELSTGVRLYRADDFRAAVRKVLHETPRRLGEVNPQVSPFFEELVHTLLEKDRTHRFQTASDVLRALSDGENGTWWQVRATALRAKTKRPLRRILIPRETGLVGREAELSTLSALYGRAKAGDGNVVLVEGEAGIGKSRLVDEFVGKLQSEGEDVNFLYGSYPPAGAATASGAFASAYREHFGTEALEETLRGYLPITPLLVPAFAALLRGDAPPQGSEPLTKDSLQTVFVHATRALAAERTTIVLIDDLHFAPEEGRSLFAALTPAVPGHRVLLIGTARPGIDEKWIVDLDRRGHTTRLPVPRLGAKDLVRLLTDALQSERLAAELAGQIALKSDGNPFFVFEILQGLKEGQFLTQRPDGTWVTTEILRDIQVPSSIRNLVQARVSGLASEERDLLDAASCLGFEFDPSLVADALGLPPIPVLKRLAQLERAHRLVRAAGDRFVFDHHQVQEGLYGGLPDPLRRAYHASLADALEAREGAATKDPTTLDGALCVDLCEHNFKSGRGERGLRFLDAALTHLEGAYLNDRAAALAERALAHPALLVGARRAELLFRRSKRLSLLGRAEEERSALMEAGSLAQAVGDGPLLVSTRICLVDLDEHLGRYVEAETGSRDALALARETGDQRGEAAAALRLGHIQLALARYEEARTQFEYALVRARAIGDTKGEGLAWHALGTVFLSQGRYDDARAHFTDTHLLWRSCGDRRLEGLGTGSLGVLCFAIGRYGEALEHFDRCLSILLEVGDRSHESSARINIGIACLSLGRYGDAKVYMERAFTLSQELGSAPEEAGACANLGSALRALGDLVAAARVFEAGRALAQRIGISKLESDNLEGLGLVASETGDPDEAIPRLREAVTFRREAGAAPVLAETLVYLGTVLADAGLTEEARAALSEATELAEALGSAGLKVRSLVQLARCPGSDPASAESAFAGEEERLSHSDRMEARFRLFQATGKREHLSEAKRLLDFAIAHAPAEYRESMVRNVRLHREIAAAAAQPDFA